MSKISLRPFVAALALVGLSSIRSSVTAEPWTLDNVTTPTANSADELPSEQFSLDRAVEFLDQAALDWTKHRKCFTCHTNYAYLMVRPTVSSEATAHRQVRAALEELVEQRWVTEGPRWDAEVIMTAAVLSMNDAQTTGKLHASTRQALDKMWTLQRADGGFDWLKCGWPPMESDDDYGIAIALLAAGAAPENYAASPAAQAGVERILAYLKQNPPPTIHHQAMLVWADSYMDNVLGVAQRQDTIEKLWSLQKSDGGWAVATLGNWQREDGQPQDVSTSDGYGTGFVVHVLRRSGIPADDPRLQHAVRWIKANQRQSGRWFTRSLNKDNKHFLSHAGSAFAVLALQSCAGDRAVP